MKTQRQESFRDTFSSDVTEENRSMSTYFVVETKPPKLPIDVLADTAPEGA